MLNSFAGIKLPGTLGGDLRFEGKINAELAKLLGRYRISLGKRALFAIKANLAYSSAAASSSSLITKSIMARA